VSGRRGEAIAARGPRASAAPLVLHAIAADAVVAEEPGYRLRRHELRALLWAKAARDTHRVRRCGRVPLGGTITLADARGAGHWRGLETCGSVACPCCGPKIRRRRAEETDLALRRHLEAGGGAVMLTLTMPHGRSSELGAMWDALAAAWRNLVSGRHRQMLRDRFGHRFTVRATEVTYGRHGWHVHLHVVLLLEQPLATLEDYRALHRFVHERWARRLVALGQPEPSLARGVMLKPIRCAGDLAGYLAKVDEDRSLGREVARPDLKAGRWRSRTLEQVLRDYQRQERPQDWRIFEEYLVVSKGRRQFDFSPGLRAALIPDVWVQSDEAIAAEAEPAVDVVRVDLELWRALVVAKLTTRALWSYEAGGMCEFRLLLRLNGLAVEVEPGWGGGVPLLRLRC